MLDSVIISQNQGRELELTQELNEFLNTGPKKRLINMTSWSVGITVYLLIIFELENGVMNA